MSGTVVAFAGAIGTGKSNISKKVQETLGWPRVSFGDYVRKIAQQLGQDSNDRAILQRLGQALVMRDTKDFVEKVLAEANWKKGDDLLVDGLRHVEVRQALIEAVGAKNFKLVVLSVDESIRRKRAETTRHIPPPQLVRYDQDLTEAQITRILPAYADLKVDTSLSEELAAQDVISKLGLQKQVEAAE